MVFDPYSLALGAGVSLMIMFPIFIYYLSVAKSHRILTSKLDKKKKSYAQFLINLRHEIKTPISIIVGKSKILSEALQAHTEPRIEEGILSLEKNSRRLLKIVNELSFFQEIDVENYVVNNVEFSSRHFFKNLIDSIGSRDSKSLKCLNLTVDDGVPEHLTLDTFALKNAITPVISNALKFSNYGPTKVNVTSESKNLLGRTELVVTVSDNGIGLEKSIQKKMYYPFFQGDSSLSRLYGGLGLGLTMTKKLIRILNGKIECRSQIGHGTVFKLRIPYTISHEITPKPSVDYSLIQEKALKDASGTRHASPRILFVDDLEEMRSLYTYFVRNLDINSFFAENGQQALQVVKEQKLANKPIDLIFMDLQMPVLNGYQATSLMRQRGDRMPIVAVTAHFAPDGDTMRNEHGFQNILVKPIDEEILSNQLDKYLGRNRRLKEVAES